MAFEAAPGFSCGFALADFFGDVGLGVGAVSAAGDGDGVQCPVEVAVAAAVEAVACCLPGGGFEGRDPAEAGERGLVAASPVVGPGDVDLGGGDGADAGLVEQLGGGGADERADRRLELVGLLGECLDPPGDRPQGLFGGGELLVGGLWRSEGAALGD